jgi:hypothetical protein
METVEDMEYESSFSGHMPGEELVDMFGPSDGSKTTTTKKGHMPGEELVDMFGPSDGSKTTTTKKSRIYVVPRSKG